MPNLRLDAKKRVSTFRKIAIGTWQTSYDPKVYGMVKLEADRVARYLEAFRAAGKRVTITHLLAKVVGQVLFEMPDANAILRFNRLYLRKDIGIFFQVAMEDDASGELDLSGATIFSPHEKSLEAIVSEFDESVRRVRKREDKLLEGSRSLMGRIPGWLLGPVLRAVSFLSYTLNLDMRWAGIPKDPFGSAMVTNIGSLGLEEAYVPLVPYSRVPLLIAVGPLRDEAVVEGGLVVSKKMLSLYATFDHRIIDGAHAARMVKTFRRIFADPEGELGPLPAAENPEPTLSNPREAR